MFMSNVFFSIIKGNYNLYSEKKKFIKKMMCMIIECRVSCQEFMCNVLIFSSIRGSCIL